MEEELKRIECLIERCKQCKLNACITCDICWSEVQAIETILNLVKKQQEEIEQLKASHIITHNKVSDEEKAKLFDVIDNSIDTYLEQTKPYWEQIMIKEKMAIEEAETIIDDMYQDRNKIIETTNDKGVTIHIDRLDDVKFTNLEFASVRALREIQSLRRKLEKKDKIIDLLKNEIWKDIKGYEGLYQISNF